MAKLTYYVVLPFTQNEGGDLCAVEPFECQSSASAVSMASGLAAKPGGAVAFSRTGDPDTGDFDDVAVLARAGEVPSDLEAAVGTASG